jgi:hypothetical protein
VNVGPFSSSGTDEMDKAWDIVLIMSQAAWESELSIHHDASC